MTPILEDKRKNILVDLYNEIRSKFKALLKSTLTLRQCTKTNI